MIFTIYFFITHLSIFPLISCVNKIETFLCNYSRCIHASIMFKQTVALYENKYDTLHETNRASIRAERKRSKFTYKTPKMHITSDGAQRLVETKAAKITTYKGTPQSRAAKIRFSTELARRNIKGHDGPTNRDNFEHFCGGEYSLGWVRNEYNEYDEEPCLDMWTQPWTHHA